MSHKKILVTGGAGFVGTNLVRRLLAAGHEILVLDDLSTGLRSNVENLIGCQLIVSNLEDATAVEDCVSKVDYIVHLAARGSVPRSIKNPRATFKVNLDGTLNLMEAARKKNTPVIFSSSSSVYGSNKQLPKNEEMWTSPMTPYAASKLSAEALIGSYGESYGVPTLVFRFFNIFGPFQRPDHDYAAVIPKWIWKAMNNEVIQVFGDGSQTRDFTFVDDVTKILQFAIEQEITSNQPVNLAFGERISLNEVIGKLRHHFPELRVEFADWRPGDVRDSQNSPKKLKQAISDLQITSFDDALNKTIRWLVENYNVITNGPAIAE